MSYIFSIWIHIKIFLSLPGYHFVSYLRTWTWIFSFWMNETPCSLRNKCDFIYSYWRGSLPESGVNARDKALFYLLKSIKLKESGKGTSVINSWYVKMRVEGKAFFINLVDPRNTTRNPGSTAPNPWRVLHITGSKPREHFSRVLECIAPCVVVISNCLNHL